jgi:glycosyltransferase involved in cell wall biosynthesis
LKILYLNHNISGEGTYFRAFNFARHLAAAGHDLTLITVSPDSRFRAHEKMVNGVRVIEAPRFLDQHRGGWAPLDILFRIKHVLTNDYDIIHGFDHKPNVSFPMYVSKLAGKKAVLVSDWADWWTKGGIAAASRLTPEILIETVLEESVRKLTGYNTVTSRVLEERARKLGINEQHIFYIPSGCDTDNIKPLSKQAVLAAKRKLKIDAKKKIFEFIGFGTGDVDILIDAFNILSGRIKNCIFLIVGPLDSRLTEKIKNSPYAPDIISTGRVPYSEIPVFAGIADVCLLPLRDNPANRGRGPIKAGDYMAAGKPIIANPVGDIDYFIKRYGVGLTAGFEPADMAEKMQKMIKDQALMKKCAGNSLKTARNILNWETVSGEMERVYKKILKER